MPEPPLPRVSIAVLRALPFGVPGTRLDAGPKDAGGPIELNRIGRQV